MTECIHCGATDDEAHGIIVGLLGELNQAVCNVCRADELQQKTMLSEREAQVVALKQLAGASHGRIAELLEIEKSTVDEYSRRVAEKRQTADQTVVELER